jgi:hypothetical protein
MMAEQFESFNLINFSDWDKNSSIGNKIGSRSIVKKLNYKNQKSKLGELLRKFDMLLFLKAVKGVMFIKCMIAKIEVCKQLYILELEQGTDVYLHQELCVDQYPSSYHYYDFILNYSLEALSQLMN